MFNPVLSSKDHGLGQARLDEALEALVARIERELMLRSTGAIGKLTEVVIRHLLSASGLTEADFRARSAGKADATIRVDGTTFTFEIKTGDGIVAAMPIGRDLEPDDICDGRDLIIYAADAIRFTSMDDLLDKTIVITHERFVTEVLTAGQKRRPNWKSGLKAATNSASLREENKVRKAEGLEPIRDCYTLQPSYHEARSALCKKSSPDTLRKFLLRVGRG